MGTVPTPWARTSPSGPTSTTCGSALDHATAETIGAPVESVTVATRRAVSPTSNCKPWGLTRILGNPRSEEHTSELQSQSNLVCRLLLERKKKLKDPRSNHNKLPNSTISRHCALNPSSSLLRYTAWCQSPCLRLST